MPVRVAVLRVRAGALVDDEAALQRGMQASSKCTVLGVALASPSTGSCRCRSARSRCIVLTEPRLWTSDPTILYRESVRSKHAPRAQTHIVRVEPSMGRSL